MSEFYNEYTTVAAVRSLQNVGGGVASKNTQDDALFLDYIREVSGEIDRLSVRSFVPRVETRYFDTPVGNARLSVYNQNTDLILDDDLLEATTITNGDGTTVDSTQCFLYPYNVYPKYKIILPPTQGYWVSNSTYSTYSVISVAGVWGFSRRYNLAWRNTSAVITAACNSSVTSLTVTTGKLTAGQFIKIDSEYLYVVSVTTGTADTVAVVRGVNGSTAASHLISTPIYLWYVDAEIEMLARQAVVGYYKVRTNPTLDTFTLDGVTFTSPKDVEAFMLKRLGAGGFIRSTFA